MNVLSVNKLTVNKNPMNLALLAAGTVSHVWFDEEMKSEKRELRAFSQPLRKKPVQQADA